jgi:FtsH-binding integral membrane protein
MAYTPDFRARPFQGSAATDQALDEGLRAYMLRVYNWMASGLVLTGIVAYTIAFTGLRQAFYRDVITASGLHGVQPTILAIISIFLPLAFVMVLSFGVNKLSQSAAQALYWAFCAAMGASLTNIFLIYTGDSIARVFFITAATFAAVSLFGYTTKRDLTNIGSFLFMGLFGIVIASIVNMFLHSSGMQLMISYLAVVVFTGLTAFQTQRIKADYLQISAVYGIAGAAKRSVYDALGLYLNFINLFMALLQIMGNRNNN